MNARNVVVNLEDGTQAVVELTEREMELARQGTISGFSIREPWSSDSEPQS